jgi:hypothetical protein
LAIYTFSLEKWLFKSFAGALYSRHFISLYILDINPWSNIWFVNIFSFFIVCLTLLTMCFGAHTSYFDVAQFIYLSFVACTFGVISRSSLPSHVMKLFPLCFLVRVNL